MNERSYQEQLQKEMSDFVNNRPFDFPSFHPWFYNEFEPLFMKMSQAQVPYRGEVIQSIFKKIRADQSEEFSILEAETIAQIWLSCPPEYLAKTVDKFILKRLWLEELMATAHFQKESKKQEIANKARNHPRIIR